jgi:hypothetical protein
MVTRRIPVLLLIVALAGCADNDGPGGASSPSSPAVADSPSFAVAVPGPSGKATGGATQTISGKVVAGVEPNCLLLQDSTGSHLLFFDDPSLRAAAKVGDEVTLVGRSQPGMMSTCQQGIPFIVSSVNGN